MKIALYPTPEQMQPLLTVPDDGPIVMVNLLRFKPSADEPDQGVSGEEAYRRYSEAMVPFITARGARVLWSGRAAGQVIGTGGEDFHFFAVVEYPSRRAFFEIATSPEVQGFGVHRSAGLEGQWLLAAKTADGL
jgi:uncharacterized protein (DUF1330 family)